MGNPTYGVPREENSSTQQRSIPRALACKKAVTHVTLSHTIVSTVHRRHRRPTQPHGMFSEPEEPIEPAPERETYLKTLDALSRMRDQCQGKLDLGADASD